MEPINIAAHRVSKRLKPAPAQTLRALKLNAPESLLWLLNWPQDSRVRCPQCQGHVPPQWVAYSEPARDEWEALRRARTEPICATCGGTGLVCPTCCGARYVINAERELGRESRVTACRDCCNMVSTQDGDKRVLYDDAEQRMIALYIGNHRDTHPVVSNPSRLLEPDPAWHAFQMEQDRARRTKQRADAQAQYAAYVEQWGDPRAAVLRGKHGNGNKSASGGTSISDKQVMAIIGEYAKAFQPAHP